VRYQNDIYVRALILLKTWRYTNHLLTYLLTAKSVLIGLSPIYILLIFCQLWTWVHILPFTAAPEICILRVEIKGPEGITSSSAMAQRPREA